jgi:hypothetical protein
MRFELKPLSFGEVIDGSFKILRGNLKFFVLVSVVCELPAMWGTAAMQSAQLQAGAVPGKPALPPGFYPLILVGMVAYVLLYGLTSTATVQIISGETVSFGKTFQRFRAVLGRASLASVIVGVIGGLFSLLLVIPGLIYWLRRSLFLPVLLIENTDARESLKRSKTLVKGGGGRMGRIFAATLLIGLVGLALRWGLGLLVPASLRGTFVGSFIPLLPQVVLAPVYGIAMVLFYYDARIRDEGYDLELRAQNAGAAAGAVAVGTA